MVLCKCRCYYGKAQEGLTLWRQDFWKGKRAVPDSTQRRERGTVQSCSMSSNSIILTSLLWCCTAPLHTAMENTSLSSFKGSVGRWKTDFEPETAQPHPCNAQQLTIMMQGFANAIGLLLPWRQLKMQAKLTHVSPHSTGQAHSHANNSWYFPLLAFRRCCKIGICTMKKLITPIIPAVHNYWSHVWGSGCRGSPNKGQHRQSILWHTHVRPLSVVILNNRSLILAPFWVSFLTLHAKQEQRKKKDQERGACKYIQSYWLARMKKCWTITEEIFCSSASCQVETEFKKKYTWE